MYFPGDVVRGGILSMGMLSGGGGGIAHGGIMSMGDVVHGGMLSMGDIVHRGYCP